MHQTNIPPTIVKFTVKYIKGRKDQYQNATSKKQQFKTGVPEAGVLSPSLFNLYTSDLPQPPHGTTLTSYTDDMNPSASHQNCHIAMQTLQPYLDEIVRWTKATILY
jgi:hypothetical protein